jgi:hypothetical protein
MEGANLSAWLHCLTVSEDLEHALGTEGRSQIWDLLDLPPSYGVAGLRSLEESADEEFLGSFARIAASFISFCRKTEQRAYIQIAETLEMLSDPEGGSCCSTLEGVREASKKTEAVREPLSAKETKVATNLVRGTKTAKVPGRFNPEKHDSAPEPMTLPEPRLLSDYITAPCRHECSIIQQVRHAKKAHIVLAALNPVKQSLLRETASQYGMDSAYYHIDTVREVVRLDRPGGGPRGGLERSISLQCGHADRTILVCMSLV